MSTDWEFFGVKKKLGVSSELVASVQKALGVVFPSSYIDLVMFSDGACPEMACFEYQDDGTCISEFFEFTDDVRLGTIAWYARPNGIPNLPDKFIPIARDAGDYLICLDFKKTPASVEIFDPNSYRSSFVASSFDKFVSLWHA